MFKKFKANIDDLFILTKTMKLKDISNIYKVGANTISKRIKQKYPEFNGKTNIISNYNCFNIIDSEEKAYWLGFMYADGCIYNNQISLSLQSIDLEHIYKFRKFVNITTKLNTIYKNGKITSYGTSVNSKQLAENLINLGCLRKKSLIIKFPTNEQVPENLLKHFIRGYFDGDGGFCKNKNVVDKIKFTSGSIIFLEKLNCYIKNIIGISHTGIYKDKRSIAYYLSINRKNDILMFSNYLYENSTIHLDRKYNLYLETKKQIIKNLTPKLCNIETCGLKHWAKGYCKKHYKSYNRKNKKEN